LALALGAAVPTGRASAQPKDRPSYAQTDAEKHAGIVPTNESYPPGSFCRYGADPSGVADSTAAINYALQSNLAVFDDYPGATRYKVTGTLRFHTGGQILRGQGMGERGANAGTTINYLGKPGGKVLSVSNGTINCSECAVRDLLIDGNGLANVGIEAYDDTIPGGSWRVRLESVAVINITSGRYPTGVYLGTRAAPGFANDTIITGCFVSKCARGMWGAGSLYQVDSTTFVGCTEAAIFGGTGSDNSSSAWTFSNSVFSSNHRDFDGVHISQASFSGCWFENSAKGIYRAANAHSASFTGCYLHTFNSQSMMDFGNAAGYHFFGGNLLPADTKSARIINVNPTAIGAVFGQPIKLRQSNGVEVPLVISPVQPGAGGVRSISAQLRNSQSVSLALGRGCFNVALSIWSVADSKVRTQASYTAFLFDGDGERLTEIASSNGSGGGQSFSLTCSNNGLTLRYKGDDTVVAYLSGSGVPG
jgi:hypothetical protein